MSKKIKNGTGRIVVRLAMLSASDLSQRVQSVARKNDLPVLAVESLVRALATAHGQRGRR